jgi:hypothetical protein
MTSANALSRRSARSSRCNDSGVRQICPVFVRVAPDGGRSSELLGAAPTEPDRGCHKPIRPHYLDRIARGCPARRSAQAVGSRIRNVRQRSPPAPHGASSIQSNEARDCMVPGAGAERARPLAERNLVASGDSGGRAPDGPLCKEAHRSEHRHRNNKHHYFKLSWHDSSRSISPSIVRGV